MAYDPVKAHEYYEKYKKKGLKKGRKKGKGKQTSLVGLSTAGLNDSGKMQWALTKESLQTEMNKALSEASSDEEKAKIRADFQNRALQALQGMKSDSSYAKPKKAKASSTKKTSTSQSSTSKSSTASGSKKPTLSKSKKEGDNVKSNDISDDDGTTTSKSKGSKRQSKKGIKVVSRGKGTEAVEKVESTQRALASMTAQVEQLRAEIDKLKALLPTMSTEKKAELKTGIIGALDTLKQKKQKAKKKKKTKGKELRG